MISLPNSQYLEREYTYSYTKNDRKLNFDFGMKYEFHSEEKIVKINRNNLQINDENPDETLIGNLVFQASEALFSLFLQINSFGYPIAVFNHSDIVERWEKLIPKFKKYYDNKRSWDLLNDIGQLYRDPEKLLEGLQNDWFYSILFFPIYGEYPKNQVIEVDYSFSSIVETTKYKIELLLKEEKTEKGKTEISLFGHSYANENEKVVGYFLLNSDRSIHEIKLDFYFASIGQDVSVFIYETKEIAEVKINHNIAYDEKAEREKLMSNKGFFIEELKDYE